MRLLYKDFNLGKLYPDYLSCLQLIYLCEDLKPMVRLSLPFGRFLTYRKFCEINDLYYKISDFKVVNKKERGKGRVLNTSIGVSGNSIRGKRYIYISKNKDFIEKDFSAISDYEFGRMLGYPDCCRKYYDDNLRLASKCQMDFIPMAIHKNEPIPFYLNYSIRYFDVAIINHFPCSLGCPDSIDIGKRNFAFLLDKYPKIADRFKKQLCSVVIYTGSNGIFYINEYKKHESLFGRRITFTKIFYTKKSSLCKELIKKKAFDIIDYKAIKVGDKVIHGDNMRVAIYE